MKQAVPGAARVAVLWNAGYQAKSAELRDTQAAAVALKITLESVEIRGPREVGPALSAIDRDRPDAIVVVADPLTVAHRREIVDQTLELHILRFRSSASSPKPVPS